MQHHASRARRAAHVIRALALLASATLLGGCATMYVDNAVKDVAASEYHKPATPGPVQLLWSFHTKGSTNARATTLLQDDARNAVIATGLFTSVSPDAVEGGAILSIVLDNVPVTSEGGAIGKGVATGATFGLVGSEVVDGYVCTVEYLAGPKATKITKVVQHAIHTTIGNKGAPQNATKAASAREAIGTVTRQAISNALLNLSNDPAFGH
ncbi:MAG: hypothetical protein JSR73_14055 [Proteobacteria bacterium]|nr:hypothetical protein [Pseudomonadota bacterium]